MKTFPQLIARYTSRLPHVGCLLWSGPTTSTGSAVVCLYGRMQSVVRKLFTEAGVDLSPSDKPERCCGTQGCVELSHWRPRPNPALAAPPPPRRFDEQSAEKVRKAHASGVTMASLAKEYRVNYKTILAIVQGKRYVPKPEEKKELLPEQWEADRTARGMSHRKYAEHLGLPLATYQRRHRAANPSVAA